MVSDNKIAMLLANEESDYEPLLREMYASDNDFIELYHETAGSGLMFCVAKTMDDFARARNFVFFSVLDIETGKSIGYFGEASTPAIASGTQGIDFNF